MSAGGECKISEMIPEERFIPMHAIRRMMPVHCGLGNNVLCSNSLFSGPSIRTRLFVCRATLQTCRSYCVHPQSVSTKRRMHRSSHRHLMYDDKFATKVTLELTSVRSFFIMYDDRWASCWVYLKHSQNAVLHCSRHFSKSMIPAPTDRTTEGLFLKSILWPSGLGILCVACKLFVNVLELKILMPPIVVPPLTCQRIFLMYLN